MTGVDDPLAGAARVERMTPARLAQIRWDLEKVAARRVYDADMRTVHAAAEDLCDEVMQLVTERDTLRQRAENAYAIGGVVCPGLGKTVEEAGELLQVLGKLIASGGQPQHWDGTDLHVRAAEEVADLQAALRFFMRMNNLPETEVDARTDAKYMLFLRWQIEHSRETEKALADG